MAEKKAAWPAARSGKASRNARVRVRALQDRWSMLRTRLAKLMEARARDLAEAPGGSTGLLIRCGSPDPVGLQSGRRPVLLAELAVHEKQAAEELGQ